MKTIHHQTEDPAASRGRVRFNFRPDRHYVMVEAPSDRWDGDQLDKLLDVIDPSTNEFAYKIEARGNNPEGRKITGHRHKVLLSCSAEFAEAVARENSNASMEVARRINAGPLTRMVNGTQMTENEELTQQEPVGLRQITSADVD